MSTMEKTKVKDPKGAKAAKGKKPKKGAPEPGVTKVFGVEISRKAATLDGPDHTALFVPTMPTVNLLGEEVLELVRLKRVKTMMAGAALVVVAGLGGLYVFQGTMIASAEADLAAAQAEAAAATAEKTALQPFKTFDDEVKARQAAITQGLAGEVLTSKILATVQDKAYEGISVNDIQVVVAAPAAAAATAAAGAAPTGNAGACLSPDPFNPAAASVGCVLVSGTATSRISLAQWIEKIDKEDLFTEVFVPGTSSDGTDGEERVAFTASLGLNAEEALSERYLNFFMTGQESQQ